LATDRNHHCSHHLIDDIINRFKLDIEQQDCRHPMGEPHRHRMLSKLIFRYLLAILLDVKAAVEY